MSADFFLDTNILCYAFDPGSENKKVKSLELIERGLSGEGTISWQVLQEFCHLSLKKFVKPMTRPFLSVYQTTVLFPLCRVWPDEELYRDALQVQGDTGYSWYDCLIVSSALRAGCRTLYTEDLQHGRKYRGLFIVNPFIQAGFT
jgi:predicted nucleic acid-binding protein